MIIFSFSQYKPDDMNYKRFLLITMVSSLVVCALVGIYILLFGDWGETEMKVFSTTQIVAFFSLLGFCSSLHQNRKYFKWISIMGVFASLVGFVLTTYMIWWTMEEGQNGDVWRAAFIAGIIAFCLAHISLMLLVKLKSRLTKYVLIATIVFILIVAGMMINAVICDFDLGDRCLRLLGVFAILDVLGTITTPLINKLTEQKT